MAKANENSTENDIKTAASSESIDQTYASMDQTCYSEENLNTAADGIRTAAEPDDVRTSRSLDSIQTCRRTDSLDTCREEDGLRTATDNNIRTAISNRDSGIQGPGVRTAVGSKSDEDVRTCRRFEDLCTCRSVEELRTAVDGANLRTACSSLCTAVENSDIRLRTAVSNPNIGTAVETTLTARGCDNTKTCRLVDSLETCLSRASNVKTAVIALQTATSLPAIVTALGPNEYEVRTARSGSRVDVRTCRILSSASETSLRTANESPSLRTARITRSKSNEQLATALNDAFALRRSIERSRSNDALRTAALHRSCSSEDVFTAFELEFQGEIKDPPSLYCMDAPLGTGKGAALLPTASQYELNDLNTVAAPQAWHDPATAYQIKVQETITPKRAHPITADKSEYVLPGMKS